MCTVNEQILGNISVLKTEKYKQETSWQLFIWLSSPLSGWFSQARDWHGSQEVEFPVRKRFSGLWSEQRSATSERTEVPSVAGTGPRCLSRGSVSSVQVVSNSCDPMNCSTPSLPVHHQLPEFTETHVHRVSDAIQPSHPLGSTSPPAPNPSSHEVAKVLEFQL